MNSPNRLVYALFDLSFVITKQEALIWLNGNFDALRGEGSHRCRRSVCQQNHASGGVIAVMEDGG